MVDPNINKTLYEKPKYKDYKSSFFKNKKTIKKQLLEKILL